VLRRHIEDADCRRVKFPAIITDFDFKESLLRGALSEMSKSGRGILKVAVIGLGKMGLLHSSLLSVLPNVELVALCDKSGMTRRVFRSFFRRVQVNDNLEDLYDLNLDAVYITTPIPSHFPIVKAIYSTRIARNVFVEKTLSSNYDGAQKLYALAQASGGTNMVGYMKRFAVTFKKAKELLSESILGDVVAFSAYAYSSDLSETSRGSRASMSRGGVLGDLGSHVLDLALWFFGDLQVESAKLESVSDLGAEDFARFRVRGPNDLKGKFDITWCRKEYRMPEFGFLIQGTDGIMSVNDDNVELELHDRKPHKWYRHDLDDNVGFLLGAPEYFREDECFIKSILDGINMEPNFYSASEVDRIIEQVKNEAYERS